MKQNSQFISASNINTYGKMSFKMREAELDFIMILQA